MEKWRIYLGEGFTQLAFARRSFADFHQAERERNVSEVFRHLHHFIVHVANVDKLLDAKTSSARAAILAGHLDLSGVDLKPFRKLRNHLEHFDERLDDWVRDFDGHAFFDMNIVTGAKGFPEKAYLRALDGNVFKFHGGEFDVTVLAAVIDELHQRIGLTLGRDA